MSESESQIPPSDPVYCLAYGNPFDGITLRGPFPSREGANAYNEWSEDSTGWVVQIEPPDPMFLEGQNA